MQEPIGLLIAVARRRMKQAVGRRVRRFGLSPQQFWVLIRILEAEGPSLGELAEQLRIDAPNTSRIVATLVTKRLVRTTADPADRRRTRIVPMAAARKLEPDLRSLALEIRGAAAEGLSAAQQDTLRTVLRKVIDNMDGLEERESKTRRRKKRTGDA